MTNKLVKEGSKLNGKPMFYVDSSIVVIMQVLDEMIKKNASEKDVLEFLTMNGRMSKRAGKNLCEKLFMLKKGEIKFCLTPTVYKEMMWDANVKETQKFVKRYCTLVLPNMDPTKFAELVKRIALELEDVKSSNGHKGLNPDFQTENDVYKDVNLEDRLILAEVMVYSILGKKNLRFLSCDKKKKKIKEDIEETRLISKRYAQNQVSKGFDIEVDRGDTEEIIEIFIHSNPNDFGNKLRFGNDRKSSDIREVSVNLEKLLKRIYIKQPKVSVLSPNEFERSGY